MAKASITRLASRLKEHEGRTSDPSTLTLGQQMLKKLEDLDGDFRTHHLSLIDLVEDEETLETEQVTLDTMMMICLLSLFVLNVSLMSIRLDPMMGHASCLVGA